MVATMLTGQSLVSGPWKQYKDEDNNKENEDLNIFVTEETF